MKKQTYIIAAIVVLALVFMSFSKGKNPASKETTDPEVDPSITDDPSVDVMLHGMPWRAYVNKHYKVTDSSGRQPSALIAHRRGIIQENDDWLNNIEEQGDDKSMMLDEALVRYSVWYLTKGSDNPKIEKRSSRTPDLW